MSKENKEKEKPQYQFDSWKHQYLVVNLALIPWATYPIMTYVGHCIVTFFAVIALLVFILAPVIEDRSTLGTFRAAVLSLAVTFLCTVFNHIGAVWICTAVLFLSCSALLQALLLNSPNKTK